MIPDRILRFVRCSSLCVVGLFVVSQSALAAGAQRGMSPLLILGPQATRFPVSARNMAFSVARLDWTARSSATTRSRYDTPIRSTR